jgi:epoxyqueuosine reductase QueG
MALWPSLSGNVINGVDEEAQRRPSPIYWHSPDSTPHGPLQRWFYARSAGDPRLAQARAERQRVLDTPMPSVSSAKTEMSPADRTQAVKAAATAAGADLVGITQVRPEWVFEGYEVSHRWIIMLGVAHDYEQMKHAPEPQAGAEVVRQYGRGNLVARHVASLIRSHGYAAEPHGGPMAGPIVLIPPAIECGFGELGKHGSIINRKFGSNFRLACVMTDVELQTDAQDDFGADMFCTNCRLCVDMCPPEAITQEKKLVRGEVKWYVDFDKCLPYFNETMGCGICLVACPWTRPGVAVRLADKLARRRSD